MKDMMKRRITEGKEEREREKKKKREREDTLY